MIKKLAAPLILALIGLIVLCGLGFWQLERSKWKNALIANIETQMASNPIPLNDIPVKCCLSTNHSYTPVHVAGTVIEGHTDLLSGHNTLGAGYRRIVPIALDVPFELGGEIIAIILVEMGFVQEAMKDTPFELTGKHLDIDGHIYIPEWAEGNFDASRNIWIGYNLRAMAAQLGASPLIIVAKQSPALEWESQPMAVQLPNNHLQYAITWFSLAIVWCMMAIYWGYTRIRKTKLG